METDATPNAAQPKSRRRWYQYGLRAPLIGVTLAGCGLGWLGFKIYEARQQKAVVAAILTLGGSVDYDYQHDAQGNRLADAAPPGPQWIAALLGEDFVGTVYSVRLSNRPVTAADLDQLAALTRLKVLWLDDTQATDAGLAHLAGLTQLETLYLDTTQVTDAGLDQLAGLTQLKWLELLGTPVTDAGLKHLHGLTKLETLSLTRTRVTDAGLEQLKGLTHLADLSLDETQITDAGLEQLKGLANLARLSLENTHVTDTGVARLQSALPNCQIKRVAMRMDTDAAPKADQSDSRPFQFSLRALLLVVTLLGLLLGVTTALYRWGEGIIINVERDAARERVLRTGDVMDYDRRLLGDEADALKAQHQPKTAAAAGSPH